MSGFEVVGLVLALYPVIVDSYKALKHSGEGIDLLLKELRTQEIIYNGFVTNLLSPSVSEAELLRLRSARSLDNKAQVHWQDANLDNDLRNRLGYERSQHVLDLIRSIYKLLDDMKRELPGAGRAFDKRFLTRIKNAKHASPKSKLNTKLEELRKLNANLQLLLGQHQLPSATGPWKKPLPALDLPRHDCTHAIHIYNAIYNGYRCNCQSAHLANLELPQITAAAEEKAAGDKPRLLELFFSPDNTDSLELDRVETLSLIIDDQNLAPKETERLRAYSSTSSNLRSSMLSAASEPIELSVYECTDNRTDAIEDLCRVVRTISTSNHAESSLSEDDLGILASDEKKYSLQAFSNSEEPVHGIITIEDLLSNSKLPLARESRISLALRLSYAILQYYSTGWIDSSWSCKDFAVAKDADEKPDESHLFVTQKFYSASNSAIIRQTNSSTLLTGIWTGIGEPILTRLGYALIELALGRRISDLRDKTLDGSMDPDLLDYFTARNILKSGDVSRAEGRGYETVVRVCLEHEFIGRSGKRTLDSREPSFHKDVEECVIAPLHCMWTENWGQYNKHLCY